MGISGVVVVGIELDPGDVLLEGGHGNRTGKLLAPAPDKIQAFAQDRGEGINVLVPCAIEVAEEQQVVVFEVFLHLAVAQERESFARQNHPSRQFDKGQVDQVFLQWLYMPEQKEKPTENPGLPWLHGSDGIHRVDLAVNVAHWTSLGGEEMPVRLRSLSFLLPT